MDYSNNAAKPGKEAVVACLKILSRQSPGITERNLFII